MNSFCVKLLSSFWKSLHFARPIVRYPNFLFRNLAIDNILRLSGEEGADVLRRDVHDPLTALLGSPGDVRSDDAVFRRQERIILPDRLRIDHVQPRSRQLAAVQRVCNVLLHNQLATGVVDENCAVLHFCDIFLY